MNIRKIKYRIAVAVVLIATAFCGCGDKDSQIIRIDETKALGAADEPDEGLSDKASVSPKMPLSYIKVYVCGAVRCPDVYEIESQARVNDAVFAAGGFADDAAKDYLNLAAALTDGQKVYIPTVTEIEEALAEGYELVGTEVNITSSTPGITTPDSKKESGTSADGKVNINRADKSTLMTLPGIGESKADKIIDYRDKNGGFSCIEDIMLVGGIKEGLYNKVKDMICVD